MYTFSIIAGSIVIVVGLIFLRIRCWSVLHPDAKLLINLLSMSCSENCSEKGKHKS